MSDGQQPADLPLPDHVAAELVHAMAEAIRALSLCKADHEAAGVIAGVAFRGAYPLIAALRAQGAAAELKRILAIADQRNIRVGWYVAINGQQTSGLRTLRDLLAADDPADDAEPPHHPKPIDVTCQPKGDPGE